MVATFICPSNCGFARVAALKTREQAEAALNRAAGEGTSKYKSRVMQEHFKLYNASFDNQSSFTVDYLKFQKKVPALRTLFTNWNPRKRLEKQLYLKTFSLENWHALTKARKREHSLDNCKGCYHHFLEVQSLLPVRSNRFKGTLKKNPFTVISNENIRPKQNSAKYTNGEIKATAKALYTKIDEKFQQIYQVKFVEALIKVPEIGIEKKKTAVEAKKERRVMYRHCKKKLRSNGKKLHF